MWSGWEPELRGVSFSVPSFAVPPSIGSNVQDIHDNTKPKRLANVAFTATSSSTHTTRIGRAATTTQVSSTTTTNGCVTMGDQVLALAMGTHPRCGLSCSLSSSAPMTSSVGATAAPWGCCGFDGMLVVRVLWEWLLETSRLFYVALSLEAPRRRGQITVGIAFGVSPLLLTLTHDMKWWAEGKSRDLLAWNQHYLVFKNIGGDSCCVQDTVTGRRTPLPDKKRPRGHYCSNGKWLVCHDMSSYELVVFEVPERRGPTGSPIFTRPTIVPLEFHCGCDPQWHDYCEDRILLCFFWLPHPSFKLVLVDLVQTHSAKKLVVLSTTKPRFWELGLIDCSFFIFQQYLVMTRQSGARSFVMVKHVGSPHTATIVTIEEGTGHLQQIAQRYLAADGGYCISPLNQSQFCVFGFENYQYDVWDINRTARPIKQERCLPGACDQGFVSGGLLFQMNYSKTEMHVAEQCSGTQVVTFKFYRPVSTVSPRSSTLWHP